MSDMNRYDKGNYGQVGSFSGRKCVNPPGGRSQICFGNDSSPIQPRFGNGSVSGINSQQPPGGRSNLSLSTYNTQPYQESTYGGQDLSVQLNLPPGQRRPPQDGRRGNSPIGSDCAGSGYGIYQGIYGSGATSSSYGLQPPAAHNGFGGAPAPSCGYHGDGGGHGISSAYSGPPLQPHPYGSYQLPAPSTSSPHNSYNAGATPSYSHQGGYGAQVQAYTAATHAMSGYSGYGGYQPPRSQSFAVGQKGQYGGKLSMQPPGGATSITFG